jgi:outer membrane receptor for ferrienterochelin and colicin
MLTHTSLRRSALVVAALLFPAAVSRAQAVAPAPSAQKSDLAAMDLEQLMKIEVVFAASKRAQQTRDVPSFVSVVTAAEIKEHGYRTLADVLETLPSFYVANDRNYSYVGVRGFERPGDYNSRVLLLLNGLRTNDNIYNQAYVGEEFGVDLDLVDRIEVIRGPSAAIYGSNAFFAVINVVTKSGASLKGAEVATSAASFGAYGGRATYGQSFTSGLDVMVSASAFDSKGQTLYYREYDDPSTNNGVARGADGESSHKLFAAASLGNFSVQAHASERNKAIPTGSYGTVFNDDRTHTVDQIRQASASYSRALEHGGSVSARVVNTRWSYSGEYAFDPTSKPVQDVAVGGAFGVEVDAARAFSRHFVNVGAQYTDDFKKDRKTYFPDPFIPLMDVRNQASSWGLFAQDEVKLLQSLTLYAGMRHDEYATFGSATSPRVGLIYAPGSATTVKLLAGRAFRTPNESELATDNGVSKPNPNLQPERIETLELVAQRMIGGGLQLSASTFRNRLSDLLSLRLDPSDSLLVYQNADAIESKGVELGLLMNRGHGVTGQLSYAVQRTEDRATGVELSNSPRHAAQLLLQVPVTSQLTAAFDAQYTSGRGTVAGNVAPAYTVTNLSVLAPKLFGRLDVSASIYNLLDTAYGVPGSDVHAQDVIAQDGRSFRVKTTVHF